MPKDGFNHCELRKTNKLFCKMCVGYNNCVKLEQEQMKRDREFERKALEQQNETIESIEKSSILSTLDKLTEKGTSNNVTTNYTRGSIISFDRGYLSALEDIKNSLK